MSDRAPIFSVGDKVFYTGETHKKELTNKDGKPVTGYIHWYVIGQPGVWTVEFPELKEPDYIIAEGFLSHVRPAKNEKQEGPEVRPRRGKREDADKKS